MKYITFVQIIIFIIAAFGITGSLETDSITVLQFITRELILWTTIGLLQIIKLAVSTRNTHSR